MIWLGQIVHKLKNRTIKDDHFWLLRLVSMDFWYSKLIKIWIVYLLFYQTSLFAVQVAYLFSNYRKMTSSVFVNFSPMFFGTPYTLCSMLTSLLVEPTLMRSARIARAKFWTVTDELDRAVLKNQMYRFLALLYSMFLLLTIPFLDVSPWSHTNTRYETYLVLTIFEEYLFGAMSSVAYLMYWLTLPSMMYAMVANGLILLYFALHFQVQFRLVGQGIRSISRGFEAERESDLRRSKEYQRAVYDRLCFYSDRYVFLKKLAKSSFEQFSGFITACTLLALLAMISITLFVINQLDSKSATMKIVGILTGLGSMLGCIFFWHSGQIFLNESEQIFDELTQCPWHLWNSRNRKTLAFFLLNAKKPVNIVIAGSHSISYEAFFQYLRPIYSVAIVMHKFRT